MRPIPAEDFSEIVSLIYDCTLDPSLWPNALNALCREMAFRTATLALQEMPSGRALLDVSVGIAPEDRERMVALAADVVEVWGGLERLMSFPLDEPQLFSMIQPDGLRGNRMVQWGLQLGLFDTMAIPLTRSPDSLSSIGFGRHYDEGPVGEPELALARLFVPHLKRAVVISRLLEARAVESETYAAVLDGLAVAILLVGPDRRLLHANRAGETMLRAADPLGLRMGRVTAPGGLATALQSALAAPRAGIARRCLGIPARRIDGEPLVLHVLPLGDTNPLPSASAAIFVAPAVQPAPAPLAAIAALFDLTPTETRVLDLIATGRTNAEIAATLRIAISTVRTHLLRLFEKTHTHRQADLVALIASFSLPLA